MSKPDEKLQKVLARTGLGSRREMERWISDGRVYINGRLAKLGDRVDAKASISVDRKAITPATAEKTRVLLYHKPRGEITSRNDPEGRDTVFKKLPRLQRGRWISVGRLDYNTSGLLLFTTDGELANALMHPSSGIEREYLARVKGEIGEADLQALKEGVLLEDGMARFTDIQDGGGKGANRWFYAVIMEGRTREVRRLWESRGCKVSRLKRVRYGSIFIPARIKKGMWMLLSAAEVKSLYRQVNLPPKPADPTPLSPNRKGGKPKPGKGKARKPGKDKDAKGGKGKHHKPAKRSKGKPAKPRDGQRKGGGESKGKKSGGEKRQKKKR